jgi:hypothetical protein
MAALPSEKIVGRAFGGVILRDDHLPGPTSYDVDGMRYVFVPKKGDTVAGYALDVESTRTPSPPEAEDFLMRRGEHRTFFQVWTELEVIAKIVNVPSHVLFKSYDPAIRIAPEICITRSDGPDHWIAVGYSAEV